MGSIAVPEAHPGDPAGNHSDYVGAALPYGVISTRHARGVLAGSEDFDVHGLIDLSMFQQLPDYERTIRDIRTYADDASQTNPTPAGNIPLE